MEIPLQITFRNIVPSPAVEMRIREKARRLERFHERITGCRVVVEAPHRQHQQGMLYRVAIDLTIPGAELVINRDNGDNHAHEDINIAVRDAFDALQRRLRDFARRRRGGGKGPWGTGAAGIAGTCRQSLKSPANERPSEPA